MKRFYNLILIILTLTHSFGATIYCSPAGGGSGVDLNNLATMPNTTGFVRGNIYKVVKGTYGQKTYTTAPSGTTLVSIVFVSEADSAVAGYSSTLHDAPAVFTGTQRFASDYWVWDGVRGGGPENDWTNNFGFKVEVTDVDSGPGIRLNADINNITLLHYEVQGNGGDAADAATANDGLATDVGCADVTVSHAYVHDVGRTIFRHSIQRMSVQYLYSGRFESHTDEHSELASVWEGPDGSAVSIQDTVWRWCIFTWFEGTGGIITAGDDALIYGCVFVNRNASFAGANGMVGTWSSSFFNNALMYNNSFLNCAKAFGPLGDCSGWDSRNNLFYDVAVTYDGSFVTHDFNHYVDLRGGSPTESNDTTGTGNPFVDSDNDDFRLESELVQGDLTVPEAYRTDWNGNVNIGRGALSFSEGGGTSGGGASVPSKIKTGGRRR